MEPKTLLVFCLIFILVPALVGPEVNGVEAGGWPALGGQNSDPVSLVNLTIIIIIIIIGIILLVYFIRKHDKSEELPKVQGEVRKVDKPVNKVQPIKKESEDMIKISNVHKVPYSVDKELRELQKKKDELEDIIGIAKVKYYQRKLDEDSYKEIVKDNQERVIRLEAKIGKIKKGIKGVGSEETTSNE